MEERQGMVGEALSRYEDDREIERVFIWEPIIMTWQILRDINDLVKEEPYKEKIKIEEIDRAKKKRYKKEVYRQMIRNWLRKYNKPI